MKRLACIIVGIIGLLALRGAMVMAQSSGYALDWWTTDAGGQSSGGSYLMQSALGQPDAGSMSGGVFTLDGGFWGFVGPAVSATLTPLNPPIIIPPQGGSYQYEGQVTNNSNSAQTFDAWVVVEGPGGVSETVGPIVVVLQAGQSASRVLTQQVPGIAPAGVYTHTGFVGTFPNVVIDSDSFTWEKAVSGSASGPVITD